MVNGFFDLKIGESVAGHVYDGNEHTELFHGLLTCDEGYGLLLVLSHPGKWLGPSDEKAIPEGNEVPPHLVFRSVLGSLSLLEAVVIRRRRNFGTAIEVTLRPRVIILSEDVLREETPLSVVEVESRIEGLDEWLSSENKTTLVTRENTTNRPTGIKVNVTNQSTEKIQLKGMELKFHSEWNSPLDQQSVSIDIYGRLQTFSSSPVPLEDHLKIHHRVRDFLVLSSGEPLRIFDTRLREKADDDLLSFRHFSNSHQRPENPKERLRRIGHLISFPDVDSEKFAKFLEEENGLADRSTSLLNLLKRPDFSFTDLVIYSGIAAESLGEIFSKVESEEKLKSSGKGAAHSTYVMRCLQQSKIDFSDELFSAEDLAKALSKYYNKTKHHEISKTPMPKVSKILGRFLTFALRKSVMVSVAKSEFELFSLGSMLEYREVMSFLKNIQITDKFWPEYKVVSEEPPQAIPK